jgi:hypothetical protein
LPFDSNGTFNRVIPGGWKADAAANIKIRADRHDDEDDGFATGLSTCITKDGRTQPTANIPFNNKKLINVGEPTAPSDAATKNYVDNFKSFTTGANISGAGPINGFVNFTSPTGINGIGWTTADMSWVGKLEEALKTSKRLAVNDKKDGTGLDVAIVDESGRINNTGWLTSNLSWDGTAWRTIALGTGTALSYASGSFGVSSNDTATTVDYQSATLRSFFTVANSDGNVTASFYKSASAKTVDVNSYMAGALRWKMTLGDVTAESATRKGSNFVLTGYANAGDAPVAVMTINREAYDVKFGGAITGASPFIIATAQPNHDDVAALNGQIHLRPDGIATPASGTIIDVNGSLKVCQGVNGVPGASGGVYAGAGLMGKASGYQGTYDNVWHNLYYSGGYEYVYVNATLMGAITWQSDYRIKRNIQPLPSMWDRVKSLNPVKYNHRRYLEFVQDDEVERWGLIAHELQEKLVNSVAIGNKDEDNVIQSVNPLTMIAVLTKALQEAMQRIEALEARAPA